MNSYDLNGVYGRIKEIGSTSEITKRIGAVKKNENMPMASPLNIMPHRSRYQIGSVLGMGKIWFSVKNNGKHVKILFRVENRLGNYS